MEEQILEIIDQDTCNCVDCKKKSAIRITLMVMEFIRWIEWEDENDDFHFIKDLTTNTYVNADDALLPVTIEEIFDYWLINIRNKKENE